MISTEATRLTRLIDRLLLSSRLNAGSALLDRQHVQPEEIAAAAVSVLGERLRAPGCVFTQSLGHDLPAILADRDALTMLLVNLLENACKFTGAEKRILLEVSRDDCRVSFRVSDNGRGLTASEPARPSVCLIAFIRRTAVSHANRAGAVWA
jgi:signal transduction histidine kinase